MMQAFEIKTQDGTLLRQYFATADVTKKTALLEMEFEEETWYQINQHECYHDEGKPCEPWVTLAQKGTAPSDDVV
jgi:hypothetical protein